MTTDTPVRPPGSWTREPLVPGPMVPLWASVWCEPVTRGFADAFARWGYLGDGVEAAVIDGWLYGAFRPLSDPGLVPVRIARAQAAADADEHLTAARDWLQVTGPGFERRRRAVTDVEEAARLIRDLVRARFAMIQGVQEVVVEWVLHAGDHLGWSPGRALDLVTTPEGRAPHLHPVVDAVSSVPSLHARIEAGEVPSVDELAAEPAVGAALAGLLDVEGDLLLLTDLTAPTLAERPGHLAAAVAAAVVTGPRPGPPAGDEGLDGPARHALERARNAHPARDASGDLLLRAMGTLRRIALATGRELGLGHPSDALLLTAEELAAALRSGSCDPALLDARRAAHERAADAPPPPVLCLPDPAGVPPQGPPPDPSGLPTAAARAMRRVGTLVELRGGHGTGDGLTGTPGAAGMHIGTARVVLEVDDAPAVRPGEVLVCPVTGPAWNIAMARCGALVCDSGGQLSHAAITARELGIPAVVGCGHATTSIRTGERVLVDGATGVVRRM